MKHYINPNSEDLGLTLVLQGDIVGVFIKNYKGRASEVAVEVNSPKTNDYSKMMLNPNSEVLTSGFNLDKGLYKIIGLQVNDSKDRVQLSYVPLIFDSNTGMLRVLMYVWAQRMNKNLRPTERTRRVAFIADMPIQEFGWLRYNPLEADWDDRITRKPSNGIITRGAAEAQRIARELGAKDNDTEEKLKSGFTVTEDKEYQEKALSLIDKPKAEQMLNSALMFNDQDLIDEIGAQDDEIRNMAAPYIGEDSWGNTFIVGLADADSDKPFHYDRLFLNPGRIVDLNKINGSLIFGNEPSITLCDNVDSYLARKAEETGSLAKAWESVYTAPSILTLTQGNFHHFLVLHTPVTTVSRLLIGTNGLLLDQLSSESNYKRLKSTDEIGTVRMNYWVPLLLFNKSDFKENGSELIELIFTLKGGEVGTKYIVFDLLEDIDGLQSVAEYLAYPITITRLSMELMTRVDGTAQLSITKETIERWGGKETTHSMTFTCEERPEDFDDFFEEL